MLFLASVSSKDHGPWFVSAGIVFVEELVLLPLGVILVPFVLAMLLVEMLSLWQRRDRSEMIEMILKDPRTSRSHIPV